MKTGCRPVSSRGSPRPCRGGTTRTCSLLLSAGECCISPAVPTDTRSAARPPQVVGSSCGVASATGRFPCSSLPAPGPFPQAGGPHPLRRRDVRRSPCENAFMAPSRSSAGQGPGCRSLPRRSCPFASGNLSGPVRPASCWAVLVLPDDEALQWIPCKIHVPRIDARFPTRG
jgi:hypothetical protein